MTHSEIHAAVREILVNELGCDLASIHSDARFIEDLNVGDDDISLYLIPELEKKFGFKGNGDDWQLVHTVGDLVALIDEALNGAPQHSKFIAFRTWKLRRLHSLGRPRFILRHGVLTTGLPLFLLATIVSWILFFSYLSVAKCGALVGILFLLCFVIGYQSGARGWASVESAFASLPDDDGSFEAFFIQDAQERAALFMGLYSRAAPWASLSAEQRVLRFCRIAFGAYLFSALLFVMALVIRSLSLSLVSGGQKIFAIAALFLLAFLAWSVGCMFIWRGVHPSSNGPPNDSPPNDPPPDDAPRPAPLEPHSPRILSASSDLPTKEGI